MRGYIVPSDRRLRGGAGRHCRISLQKGAATEFPPSRGGTSEEGKEQGRRPRVCLLFFERLFQYISTPAAVFSQFSAVSPATGRIRQTGLCSDVFFSPGGARTPRNRWKTRFGMVAKIIWEGNVSTSRSGRQPAPRTPLPSPSIRPEPRPPAGAERRNPAGAPPGKQWRRHRAVPEAGLRRQPDFSPSTSLKAGCFASVEMTGGVLRSGRSGRQGAGRGGHTSGVGKSSYRERNWQCQGLLSKKRKYF